MENYWGERKRERESDGLRENLLKDVVSRDLPRRKVEQASFHERQNFWTERVVPRSRHFPSFEALMATEFVAFMKKLTSSPGF